MQVFQIDYDESLEPFDYERAELAKIGAEIVSGNCTSAEEVVARAADARVLWLAWKPAVDHAVLEQLPNVELVIRWGVGYDTIDVDAATALGVAVANAPDYGTIDVAEHVIALLLSGSRRVPWYHETMKAGGWPDPDPGFHHRLNGRTLGLVGVGRIGAAVAQRARGLGLSVIGHDPGVSSDHLASLGIESVELDALLARADYVSLHVPLTAQTEHLMNADRLAQLKPGAALINASRGKVVDTDALISTLNSGRLDWAALDVYETEPLPPDSPLRTTPHVILTPHLAGYSIEAWSDLRDEMCLTTTQWLTDGWADRVVNPQVRPHLRAGRKG